MDLVATVRKQGSRGGANFSWDDVAHSARREFYLGHSLMAPVGRWQQSRDIEWFNKGANEEADAEREKARREELARVKQAEEEAMARALGLPPGMLLGAAAANDKGTGTGANSIAVPAGQSRVVAPPVTEDTEKEREDGGRRRHGHSHGHRDRDRSHRPSHRDHRDRDRDRSHRDHHHDNDDDRRRDRHHHDHHRHHHDRRRRSRSRSRSPATSSRHRSDDRRDRRDRPDGAAADKTDRTDGHSRRRDHRSP